MTKHYHHHSHSRHHDKPSFTGRSNNSYRENRRPYQEERGPSRREQSYVRTQGQPARQSHAGSNRNRSYTAAKTRRFDQKPRYTPPRYERRDFTKQKRITRVPRGKRTPPGIRRKVITKGRRGINPRRLRSRKSFLTKNKTLVLGNPSRKRLGKGSALLRTRAKKQLKAAQFKKSKISPNRSPRKNRIFKAKRNGKFSPNKRSKKIFKKGGKKGKTLFGKKGSPKQMRKGKDKFFKGKGKRPDADFLDKELENYWIKQGEKNTAETHLDNDMDEYWKKEGSVATNANESSISLSKISTIEQSCLKGSPLFQSTNLQTTAI